jgi:hypothetical protein
VYLPKCINYLVMDSKLSAAISWLLENAQQIASLAMRRSQILQLNSAPGSSVQGRKAN